MLFEVLLLAYLLLHCLLVLVSLNDELSWIRQSGVRAIRLSHHLQGGRLLVKCSCLFIITGISYGTIHNSFPINNALLAVVSMRCSRLVLLPWNDELGWCWIKWILSYHLMNVLGVECYLGTLNNIRLMFVRVATSCNTFYSRLNLKKLVVWVFAIMRRYRCNFSADGAWRRLR